MNCSFSWDSIKQNSCDSLCVGQVGGERLPLLLEHLSLGVDQLDAVVALGVVRGGYHHSDRGWKSSMYRVTHQVGSNLPLTSEQKFRFGLACPDLARQKRNFSFNVNGRVWTNRMCHPVERLVFCTLKWVFVSKKVAWFNKLMDKSELFYIYLPTQKHIFMVHFHSFIDAFSHPSSVSTSTQPGSPSCTWRGPIHQLCKK